MFEAKDFAPARDADIEVELAALESALAPNSQPPVAPNKGFQLPRRLWLSMFACYGVFFLGISIATGGSGAARFAIAVSIIYTLIYFGVARIGSKQAGPEERSPLDQGKPLQTWTGPMDASSVFGQVLIVPIAIAIFGIAIMFISFAVK